MKFLRRHSSEAGEPNVRQHSAGCYQLGEATIGDDLEPSPLPANVEPGQFIGFNFNVATDEVEKVVKADENPDNPDAPVEKVESVFDMRSRRWHRSSLDLRFSRAIRSRKITVRHRVRGTTRARRSSPTRRRSCSRSSSRSGDSGSGDPAPGEPADQPSLLSLRLRADRRGDRRALPHRGGSSRGRDRRGAWTCERHSRGGRRPPEATA